MKSGTIIQDTLDFSRECFTVLLFAILLLVTGCGSSVDSLRADLAPPPPFMVVSGGGQEMFGPAVPVEMALRMALLQGISNIEPAAGDEMPSEEPSAGCRARTGLTPQESRLSFAGRDILHYDSDLSFSRAHSSHDSAEMMLRLSFALPVAQKIGCR